MTEREKRRLAQKHFAKLGDLLNSFYSFLGRTPKPSDDEVRATFIKHRTAWVEYSVKHELDEATRQEFTRQVSLVWNSKKTQSTTESETQKSSKKDTSSSMN